MEDWISSNKVGVAGFECIPLFGTEVHNPVIYHLLNSNKPVFLWLDKDQISLVYKKAARLSSVIGREVKVVVTDKDPKSYSLEEIKNAVS